MSREHWNESRGEQGHVYVVGEHGLWERARTGHSVAGVVHHSDRGGQTRFKGSSQLRRIEKRDTVLLDPDVGLADPAPGDAALIDKRLSDLAASGSPWHNHFKLHCRDSHSQ